MALRSVAATLRGPAAYALRRQPGPGVPPAVLSRSLGTTGTVSASASQAKLLMSNVIKIIQEDAVYMHGMKNLLVELENVGKIAQQRAVELEQVRRQKKKARTICCFTLAAVPCMAVYIATRLPGLHKALGVDL